MAVKKINIRTERCGRGRVTSPDGGASAARCSFISTTTRRAPRRPTHADCPNYCSKRGNKMGYSRVRSHEKQVADVVAGLADAGGFPAFSEPPAMSDVSATC